MNGSINPLLVAVCALVPFSATACCDRAACAALASAVRDATIAQGIAGAGGSSDDVLQPSGCLNCSEGGGTITLVEAPSEILDDDEAAALFFSDASREAVDFIGHYEHATDVGDFLACAVAGARGNCAPVKVLPSSLTTVHLAGSIGGAAVKVFTAAGDLEERSYFVDTTSLEAAN